MRKVTKILVTCSLVIPMLVYVIITIKNLHNFYKFDIFDDDSDDDDFYNDILDNFQSWPDEDIDE